MNRSLFLVLNGAIAIGLSAPAFAQMSTTTTTTTTEKTTVTSPAGPVVKTTEIDFAPAGTHGLNVQMLRDFQQLKEEDPEMAHAIARNPRVVENDSFLRKYPALEEFFDQYPQARAQIISSPGNFVTPVAGSTWQSERAQVEGSER